MSVKLGDEQQLALDRLIDFTKQNSDTCFCLMGSAGTGKTLLTKYYIDYLIDNSIPYCLCAPTHKAALVLKRSTNREVCTLHKLLALSPNLDILTLDLNNLLFNIGNSQLNIPYKGIVLVDEASMISDDLFNLLTQKCNEKKSKIVFVGDPAQLIPVKAQKSSLALQVDNCITLKKIYRQSGENGLLPILQKLRTQVITKLPSVKTPEGKLYITSDTRQFCQAAVKFAQKAIDTHDILYTKVAAYTNARVNDYNTLIHKSIAGNEEYIRGEIVTCGENIDLNGYKLYNSMDYIVWADPRPTSIVIPNIGVFPGYTLELYDSLTQCRVSVNILSRNLHPADYERIAAKLEDIRVTAVRAKSTAKKMAWRNYYNTLNSFITPVNLVADDSRLIRKQSLDYGYASTVHRLQGSSYTNILVDWRNLNSCTDEVVKRQLQYVALSRTRTNAIVLQ